MANFAGENLLDPVTGGGKEVTEGTSAPISAEIGATGGAAQVGQNPFPVRFKPLNCGLDTP